MAIPRVFHQLWKSPDTPDRYTPLRETWLRRNPGWKMRLWTDDDLDELVESRYPELLGLYRGYDRNISRADLGRYLVLETFGGVYADLDCECLRPLGPLLDGPSLLIGVEPDEHVNRPFVRKRGLTRILCPSFIASAPGHPFWRDVRAGALAAAGETDVLDQTGPFMLSRTFEASAVAAEVTLAPAAQIYPFTKDQCWGGAVFELETWERSSRDAFVAHYWDGGWFRGPTPLDGLPWGLWVEYTAAPTPPPVLPHPSEATMISCITVATDEKGLDLAIEGYRRQTHANKELIVVCPDPGGPAARVAASTGRADIRVLAATTADVAGRLAEGIAAASGQLICRWDAGELHDPRRLEIQFEVLRRAHAHACVMKRGLAWRPSDRRLAITAVSPEAGSLMWIKDAISAEALADPEPAERLAETARVASFDLPQLRVRVSPPGDEAFDAAWANAGVRFEGERGAAMTDELAKRLPMAMAAPGVGRPAARGQAQQVGRSSS